MSQKLLERIASGALSRQDLARLRANALPLAERGDEGAKAVLEALEANAVPSDRYILFMGFCPSADFDNRLDIGWRAESVCYYRNSKDTSGQLERFQSMLRGDLIVLKKRHEFGKTMQLFGHGRVRGIRGGQYRDLDVDWSPQTEVITVPLLGCNSTVDVRSLAQVDAEMPETFYAWLKA